MSRLDAYMLIKEAAAYLGVAPNTLRNWDRDGKIPVYRHPVSNYRLFKREELEEVLEQLEESARKPAKAK